MFEMLSANHIDVRFAFNETLQIPETSHVRSAELTSLQQSATAASCTWFSPNGSIQLLRFPAPGQAACETPGRLAKLIMSCLPRLKAPRISRSASENDLKLTFEITECFEISVCKAEAGRVFSPLDGHPQDAGYGAPTTGIERPFRGYGSETQTRSCFRLQI